MAKFLIEPHFRLQEWVAEEKGYFRAEGLDYEFREQVRATGGKIHDKGDKVGAFQSFEEGRKSNVSCACHWTVNVAASNGHGRMYTDVYSVAPAGIFVAANSKIKTPADLAGVPVSVGYQSGSHYATVQALEAYLKPDEIKLNYADGMLFAPHGEADRRHRAGGESVQRTLLLRRAARLPQSDRHHVHDRHHDPRRSRSGGFAQILPRLAQGAARHRPAAGALYALLQERIPRPLPCA